jgi:hypothetical protein
VKGKCLFVVAAMAALLTAAPKAAVPRLPNFAAWRKAQSQFAPRMGWGLPADQAAAMQEFGLGSVERDTYARGRQQIQILAMRFADATGAYGAFTYYRPGNFHRFDLAQPQEAANSGGTRILFARGDWLIQVQLSQPNELTAGDMRALTHALPLLADSDLTLPSLPSYLPSKGLETDSIRYSEGPVAFAAGCNWLPPSQLGFNLDAEAAVGDYPAPGAASAAASAQIAVLSYPTPQMARARLPQLAALPGITARRTGPVLLLAHGFTPAAAQALLNSVNYEANVTLVPPTPVGIEALPALILGIFVLCGILMGVAVVVGVLTGGIRVLVQRVLPERFHRPPPEGLIQLHLR